MRHTHCTCSNSPFALKLQSPKALGAAACSTDIACGEGTLPLERMHVASSVLPEVLKANPVNVKRAKYVTKWKLEHVRNEFMNYMRKVLTRIFRTKLDNITELTCGTHRRVMRRVSTRILREAADNPHRQLVMEKSKLAGVVTQKWGTNDPRNERARIHT